MTEMVAARISFAPWGLNNNLTYIYEEHVDVKRPAVLEVKFLLLYET